MICCCVAKSSELHVRVSEKNSISHPPSTRQHYPGITRRVFAPVSTQLVLEWYGGTAGEEEIETVTWEHGGEGKGEGRGDGAGSG